MGQLDDPLIKAHQERVIYFDENMLHTSVLQSIFYTECPPCLLPWRKILSSSFLSHLSVPSLLLFYLLPVSALCEQIDVPHKIRASALIGYKGSWRLYAAIQAEFISSRFILSVFLVVYSRVFRVLIYVIFSSLFISTSSDLEGLDLRCSSGDG